MRVPCQGNGRRRLPSARAPLASLGALCALALLAPAALADTRYAEPGPGGGDPACPQADPCDIETAVNDAVEGDEIVVLPGTYSVSTSLGISEVGMVLHGQEGQPRPVIETTAFTGLSVANGSATVRDLTIRHTGSGAALVLLGTAERIFASSDSAACLLAIAGEPLLGDSACWTTAGAEAALGVAPGFEVTQRLRNVTAVSAAGPGISVSSTLSTGVSATLEAKNVIARGSALGGSAPDVFAVATGAGAIQVDLDHSNYATVGGPDSASVTPPGSGTNQTAAPHFADLPGGDFHQLPDSPTVDAGGADSVLGPLGPFDLDREPRIQGAAVDIGADELTPPPQDEEDSAPSPPSTPPPSTPPPPPTDSTAPKLWGLRVVPRVFAIAKTPTAVSAARTKGKRNNRRVRRGTLVRYRLSEAARVALLVQRGRPGLRRRVRGKVRCVRPTPRLARRGAGRCVRWGKAGPLLRRQGRHGLNRFRFTGRIDRRALRPGRYRLLVRATDAAGNRSELRRRGFRVLRPR